MIPINFVPLSIQLNDIADEFYLTRQEHDSMLDAMVKSITANFADLWRQEAGKELHKSRMSFQRSIQVVDSGRFSGSVVLYGVLNNMIESGAPAFDMKIGFAASQKKVTKLQVDKKGKLIRDEDGRAQAGGWYLTVPFRWATPDAGGFSEVFSGVLPREIYSILQTLEVSNSQIGSGTSTGQGISNDSLPDQYKIPKVRGEFSDLVSREKTKFGEYTNKSSIYSGITKGSKTYENTTQGQYVSFRRVSDKSDLSSWIHTGILARNLGDRALDRLDIERIVEVTRDNFLSSIFND